MKKLGLIGGTGPESTVEYYKGIVYGVQKQCGHFPPLAIESLSVFEVLGFCEKKDYEGLSDYLLRGIRNLAAAGAECAALTGITPHIVFDILSQNSPIPLISMVETARERAAASGFKKVALLGTRPTMESRFFPDSFARRGIEVVTPNESERRYIETKIETELEFGTIIPKTQQGLRTIAERLEKEETAEAIVLGCTELPLAFRGIEMSVPFLDVMQIHIEALVNRIAESATENHAAKMDAFARLEEFRKTAPPGMNPENERAEAMEEKYGHIEE